MTYYGDAGKLKHKHSHLVEAQKQRRQRSLSFLTLEATILGIVHSALQAPADGTFMRVLTWITGIALAVVVVGLVTGLIPPPKNAFADSSKIVSLYYDGQKKVVTTGAPTVAAALSEAGVSIGAGDLVEPSPGTQIPSGFFNINVYRSRPVVVVDGSVRKTVQTALQSNRLIAEQAGIIVYPEDTYGTEIINDIASLGTVGQMITIKRAIPVIILADGQEQMVRTQQETVGQLLHERDVAFGPQDTVSVDRGSAIKPGMVVQINRVKVVVVKQTEAIVHQVTTVKDPNLESGKVAVKVAGKDGEKEVTYRVHYQNGTERSRELLTQTIASQPVTEVKVVGTKIVYTANPVELGRQLAAERGWTGSQWDDLYTLWWHESKWNPNARNASGACGIPQAYPCSKISDFSTAGQIKWGLGYIASRYGNPTSALAYWERNNSY